MKILVPIDLKQKPDLKWLTKLGKKHNITLLYTFPPIFDFATRKEARLKKTEKVANKELKKMANKLKSKNLPVQYLVRQGEKGNVIDTITKKDKFDLLLLQGNKARGLSKIIFGNTLPLFLPESKIPVLVLPAN